MKNGIKILKKPAICPKKKNKRLLGHCFDSSKTIIIVNISGSVNIQKKHIFHGFFDFCPTHRLPLHWCCPLKKINVIPEELESAWNKIFESRADVTLTVTLNIVKTPDDMIMDNRPLYTL